VLIWASDHENSEALHNALFLVVALVLVAALAFLYDKTQAVDLRERNDILGLLRELKEIDSRWDVDVLRMHSELGAAELPAIDRAAAANKALQNLAEAAQRTESPALASGLPELNNAIQEKASLVDRFRAENRAARDALQATLKAATELNTQMPELKLRTPAPTQALSQVAATAPLYYLTGLDQQRSTLEAAAAQVRAGVPEAVREKAAQLDQVVQDLARHKPLEQELFSKVTFLTAGPRLDNLTFSFNSELEATLQDKERFRVYLIYYAGALLILLAYLGFQLKAANVTLEHRVEERTRELSQALKNLKESEAQLIQSEKMSSLGQMVAGVAHEINTPLAYVKNSLGTVSDKLPDLESALKESERLLALLQAASNVNPELLSRQFALVSQQIAHLKHQQVVEELNALIKDGLYGTGQMAEIVGNLKDFSRLDRSKVTNFNLNEGLDSTLLLAKHLVKGVAIDKRFGQIPEIICAPSQINQVFLNLITNATQALEPGKGKITLTTRSVDGGVAVDVTDNGKGIPPEILPKIFDPFFSTKEVGKGTGLGLSICYKIVQEHGGRINVQSQVGTGTTFTVWLPLKPSAAAQPRPRPPTPWQCPRKSASTRSRKCWVKAAWAWSTRPLTARSRARWRSRPSPSPSSTPARSDT
jgi:signal transduction histidine kinase